jgi:hypothetical protein
MIFNVAAGIVLGYICLALFIAGLRAIGDRF